MQNHQSALTTKRCNRCHCTHLHSDAIAAHAHLHTQNLHSDAIAVAAYTYTAIRSLPLHTPRLLPMHMPAQRYDRCFRTHKHSDAIAVSADTQLHSDTIAVNPRCIPHIDKIAVSPMCTHTATRSLPCPHMESKLECQCVQRSRSHCTN